MTLTPDTIRTFVLSHPDAAFLTTGEVDEIVAEFLYSLKREAAWDARRKLRPGVGMAVHHIDGDPFNNSPENLRLVPMRENRTHRKGTRP
jgi:hypothetical protein